MFARLTVESNSEMSDELRSFVALCSNAGVEILHGLFKPHLYGKEGGYPYFLLNQHALRQNE